MGSTMGQKPALSAMIKIHYQFGHVNGLLGVR